MNAENRFKDVTISEHPLHRDGEEIGKMAIFMADSKHAYPKGLLDAAVSSYVGKETHFQFIEIWLDNPYLRIVTTDINKLKFDQFFNQSITTHEQVMA